MWTFYILRIILYLYITDGPCQEEVCACVVNDTRNVSQTNKQLHFILILSKCVQSVVVVQSFNLDDVEVRILKCLQYQIAT